ncbi:hypothetical protein E2C01_018756 [Portunus trituberculatus]|uniref:Secreted protein n=1 Tax=Portunus trituberculatus TaxID=210409 RepID=A0A5B7DWI8_PORTR|nr:hypothetical protein [Portunus trituberculatus]
MTLACAVVAAAAAAATAAAAAAAADVEESDSHLANNGLLARAVAPDDSIEVRGLRRPRGRRPRPALWPWRTRYGRADEGARGKGRRGGRVSGTSPALEEPLAVLELLRSDGGLGVVVVVVVVVVVEVVGVAEVRAVLLRRRWCRIRRLPPPPDGRRLREVRRECDLRPVVSDLSSTFFLRPLPPACVLHRLHLIFPLTLRQRRAELGLRGAVVTVVVGRTVVVVVVVVEVVVVVVVVVVTSVTLSLASRGSPATATLYSLYPAQRWSGRPSCFWYFLMILLVLFLGSGGKRKKCSFPRCSFTSRARLMRPLVEMARYRLL